MKQFFLRDLDGPDNKFTMYQGWDGDISLTIIDGKGIYHNVRVGMGGNSGDPNADVKDIKYLKKALQNLMMEFKYQSGEISESEIKKWRNV